MIGIKVSKTHTFEKKLIEKTCPVLYETALVKSAQRKG